MPLPPPVSRAVVGAYVKAYDVDLDEAEPINGSGAYPSFDAFFTRALRPDARTLAGDGSLLVSPSDGRLDAAGPVAEDGIITVKGRPYRASDLLGEGHERRYLGGRFAVIYLSPRDYHRVHAPCDGDLVEVRSYPGELFPVNSISERHIPDFLARNRRVAIELNAGSPADGGFGTVTIVMVAAMVVGRITVTGIEARDVPLGVHHLKPARRLTRGDELGVFHIGSTAVLFTEPELGDVVTRAHGPVRLGDALAPAVDPAKPSSRAAAAEGADV